MGVTKRIRVLVLTGCVSRNAGGLYFSVRALTKALARNFDLDVEVWAIEDELSKDDVHEWHPLKVQLYKSSGLGKFGLSGQMFMDLAQARFDVVHIHGVWGFHSALGNLCIAKKIPFIVSPRGMLDPWILSRHNLIKRGYRSFLESRVIAGARYLHVLSDKEATAVRTLNWNSNIICIPNGVDVLGRPEVKSYLSDAPKTLLYIGRYDEKKGLLEFLNVWSSLEENVRRGWMLRLHGWGDEAYVKKLRCAISDLSLGESVFLGDAVFGEEKENLLRGAHAFVLPTKSEGLPMAVLEAWASGLPVLTTVDANLPSGFAVGAAVDLGGAKFWGEVLERFLSMAPAEFQLMSERAYLHASEDFGWDAIAGEVFSLYENCLLQ